ncbi:hypothetical protein EHEL_071340 [Encephalitozoon hellem ATCC 50504]|uniref:Uncharacterized protein n=1 Tax=Encephalitozoon hellem TaxID=27973 RepID=A0A9Q9CCW3_ENCHE|nr:uncharacterized protein EHEL_071340 [Encephalitozoon hellem ATCC 50504]AFM98660.1 hypothetical protein EHEL_071340 [Encephalitozoon hellem ATCC 50504]UTX43609.1 hypothetical protein GPU96_07g13700 [Encephalitozoon hellem]WEL39084.1 hypothetical protein PFJ87_07g01620 [Encephalitozoon hellem]|eukprot:XP_003887641.1 hypothetical protein EHEL_071340 [Encephalitozoon hellem ATCC 50504]
MKRSEFLEMFEKTDGGLFVPKDQSQNWCRHFGMKRGKVLYLCEEDVLYLYDREAKTEYPVRAKAYFFVRNSCYNLLPDEGGRLLLYKRHKNFNRKKDRPICPMRYVLRDEYIEDISLDTKDEVVCVLSDDVFTFLRVKEIERLDSETPESLKK